ncbi:hypothetical protein [Microtetraspora fusca]|uniref:hypothetical protein n=1 Tax=Microtetraspora fusca TaxID=1997 RepID=UPI000A480A04|nr:hypothetical protein [Microtetraspora fusca]
MKKVHLGSQGLVVSAEGLGCMSMSTTYGPSDEQEGLATLPSSSMGILGRA